MYKNGFLSFVRSCKHNNQHFLKAQCNAGMHKTVKYYTVLKLDEHAGIEGSHCECAASSGSNAHCKHGILVLNSVVHLVHHGIFIARDSCRQKFQQFHKPKKVYYGTPLEASVLTTKKRSKCEVYDPRPPKYRKTGLVNDRAHSLCAPLELNVAIQHILRPANPYAIEWDHEYSRVTGQKEFLKTLELCNIVDDDILEIEGLTRGQYANKLWFEHRSYRITVIPNNIE